MTVKSHSTKVARNWSQLWGIAPFSPQGLIKIWETSLVLPEEEGSLMSSPSRPPWTSSKSLEQPLKSSCFCAIWIGLFATPVPKIPPSTQTKQSTIVLGLAILLENKPWRCTSLANHWTHAPSPSLRRPTYPAQIFHLFSPSRNI